MSRDINHLCGCVRDRFLEFRDRLEELEEPIHFSTIDTLRTAAEQKANLRNKVSWTLNSKHLPQPPYGLSLAFDVCPVPLLTKKLWAPKDPSWKVLGEVGKSVGLRWGGRWKQKDMGHFELRKCACDD